MHNKIGLPPSVIRSRIVVFYKSGLFDDHRSAPPAGQRPLVGVSQKAVERYVPPRLHLRPYVGTERPRLKHKI